MATITGEIESPSETPSADIPFLSRVEVRGYKSISYCDVALSPLTLLVGRNGTGKSNFLDAIAFVRDILEHGLFDAIEDHGGLSIFSKSDFSDVIEIRLHVQFSSVRDCVGSFGIRIRKDERQGAVIESEVLDLTNVGNSRNFGYSRMRSDFRFHGDTPKDLVNVSGPYLLLSRLHLQPYIDLRLCIASIGRFGFHPDLMRILQRPIGGPQLADTGVNFARTIEGIREIGESHLDRIKDYLRVIVPEVIDFRVVSYGDYETIRFTMNAGDGGLELDASSMSDGTLRALGALLAVFQMPLPHGYPSLVLIEEPETALHPAATRALVDALDEATLNTQIILTTHSADFLDNPVVLPECVRVVEMVRGRTVIGGVDEASVEIVSKTINTLGNLERDDLLEPDVNEIERQISREAKAILP